MSQSRYWIALGTVAAAVLVMEVVVGHAVPLRVPLQDLPFEISGWTGRVESGDSSYLERARPDEFVFRRYADDEGRDLLLYVGYYGREATRAQVNAVCYGQCRIVSRGAESLKPDRGAPAMNRAEVLQNGVAMAVLFWYQHSGSVTQDPYKGKMEQARRVLLSRRSDGAFVRISVPIITSESEARERGLAFARILLPMIQRYLPD